MYFTITTIIRNHQKNVRNYLSSYINRPSSKSFNGLLALASALVGRWPSPVHRSCRPWHSPASSGVVLHDLKSVICRPYLCTLELSISLTIHPFSIYLPMYLCIYRPNLSIRLFTNLSTLVSMYTCIQACIHAYIHRYMPAYILTYLRTCMHAYLHTYIQTNKHTYIHTHIHT